jgi:flavin-dependent dehydrogenase
MDRYDAIVVGARAAGSPAAMLLARKGYRVLLVDRATFPSDTISTHLVHAPGMARLAGWGLADRVVATGCPPIDTYRFDLGPFAIVGAPGLPDGQLPAHAPRRLVLDNILVDAAAEAGAEVRERFSVEGLLTEDGVVTGIRGREGAGSPIVERARIVIGADGVDSVVARLVEAERYVHVPAQEALYFAYWSHLSTDGEFQLYGRDRRGFALVPTNDGLTVALVAWPLDEFDANRRDLLGNYLRAFDAEPSLADRVRGARRESRPVGKVMDNFYRRSWGPGWALIGDAAYHKDAVTAQGISDAFRDAEAATAAVDEVFSGRRGWADAFRELEAERDRMTGPMFQLTCQLASMEPATDDTAQLFAAIAASPAASDAFMSMIAGLSPVEAFFDPSRIERVLAASA